MASLVELRCERRWDLGRLEMWTQTALGCRRQRGSLDVGTWVNQRSGVSQDLGRSALWMRPASGFRKQRGLIDVGTWVDWRRGVGQADRVSRTASRTASGPWLVGAADVNVVRMSETAWDDCGVDWRQGVGQAGESVGQSASGRRLVWGVLVELDVEPSIGFCLAIVWVERCWDIGLAIGWRHGLSGRGFGGQRQRGCLGRSLGERRL